MKEHGIIFSAPMVLALLAGRKTQTRRLASSPLHERVSAGDRLWVRETVQAVEDEDGFDRVLYAADKVTRVIDNTKEAADRWLALRHYDQKRRRPGPLVPAIHMPRWACRLVLEVTDVGEECLQTLDHESPDAEAEGIYFDKIGWTAGDIPRIGQSWSATPGIAYRNLWRALHTKPGERWEDNPDVVVFTFKVEQL